MHPSDESVTAYTPSVPTSSITYIFEPEYIERTYPTRDTMTETPVPPPSPTDPAPPQPQPAPSPAPSPTQPA